MAVSIEELDLELDLDFGHDDFKTKSKEKQPLLFGGKNSEGKPGNVLGPRILQNKLNLSNTRNKQTGSFNEVSPSSTAAELLGRVGAAIDKERKIWMGQNAFDQRQNSYSSLTRESYSQCENNRPVMLMTGTPLPRTTPKMTEFFGNDKSNQEFDSPFLENNFSPK